MKREIDISEAYWLYENIQYFNIIFVGAVITLVLSVFLSIIISCFYQRTQLKIPNSNLLVSTSTYCVKYTFQPDWKESEKGSAFSRFDVMSMLLMEYHHHRFCSVTLPILKLSLLSKCHQHIKYSQRVFAAMKIFHLLVPILMILFLYMPPVSRVFQIALRGGGEGWGDQKFCWWGNFFFTGGDLHK